MTVTARNEVNRGGLAVVVLGSCAMRPRGIGCIQGRSRGCANAPVQRRLAISIGNKCGVEIMAEQQGQYPVKRRVTVAETENLRVRELALDDGQCVPWHYHNNITDTFFCMQGPMQVSTRAPDAVHVLQPGETFAVPPGTAHLVTGVAGGPCHFMVIQGVGKYDYVAVEA